MIKLSDNITGALKMIKQSGNPLRSMLREMVPGLVVLTVIAFLISLIWGFKLSVLIGFLVGLIFVVLSYFYMAETIYKSVRQSKKKAQRLMFFCYLSRYLMLVLLCLIAIKTKLFSVFGVLIPQLFPRIVLTLGNFKERKAVKNDKSSANK